MANSYLKNAKSAIRHKKRKKKLKQASKCLSTDRPWCMLGISGQSSIDNLAQLMQLQCNRMPVMQVCKIANKSLCFKELMAYPL